MDNAGEWQRWQLAVATFSCPFCGCGKNRGCVAIGDDIFSEPRTLVKPHENRLRLLDETDPAIRGSFS